MREFPRLDDNPAVTVQTSSMATQQQLLSAFDGLLQPGRFKDYGPNGLPVEGKAEVARIVSGVTASRGLIEAAIQARAHDINLFAYHLPLDAHPELGNNAQLGLKLGLRASCTFGEQELGFMGERSDAAAFADAGALASHLEQALRHAVVQVSGGAGALRKIAWCTGGAQGYFEDAIAAGADAFITGEISEPQTHYARECGVAYFACGHHATERYGAPAVAGHVAAAFGIEHRFIDIDNPA